MAEYVTQEEFVAARDLARRSAGSLIVIEEALSLALMLVLRDAADANALGAHADQMERAAQQVARLNDKKVGEGAIETAAQLRRGMEDRATNLLQDIGGNRSARQSDANTEILEKMAELTGKVRKLADRDSETIAFGNSLAHAIAVLYARAIMGSDAKGPVNPKLLLAPLQRAAKTGEAAADGIEAAQYRRVIGLLLQYLGGPSLQGE
jgi:hypothetical protein